MGYDRLKKKNFFSSFLITPKLYLTRLLTSFNGAGGARLRICQGENITQDFDFCKTMSGRHPSVIARRPKGRRGDPDPGLRPLILGSLRVGSRYRARSFGRQKGRPKRPSGQGV